MERTPDRSMFEQSEEAWIVDTVLMEFNRPVIGEGSAGASSLLSEENLEWHNATHRKTDEFYAQTLICEESARAHEVQMYEDRYSKEADPLAGTAPMLVPDNNVATSSENDLKLYRGQRPSSETPMRRFVTLGLTQDTHPWLAKDTMEHLGISQGDLETASIRRLAAEFIAADDVSEEDVDEGSLFSSSPTLSAPITHRNKRQRGVAGAARVQRVTRIIKRQSEGREAKGAKTQHGQFGLPGI